MEKEDKITKSKNNHKRTASIKLILLLLKLLIALFVYLVFFRLVFGITRMDSPSMSPTINEGELLMVFRLEPKYDIGDVVIIKKNNKTQILRIVATEGQIVSISKDNTLLVDGVPEDHLVFYNTKANEKSDIKFPYEVESGKFFVLNDYRLTADDSREYGTITKEDIKGKVIGKLQVRDI